MKLHTVESRNGPCGPDYEMVEHPFGQWALHSDAQAAIKEAVEQRDTTWIEILTGLGKADTASIVAAAIRARNTS